MHPVYHAKITVSTKNFPRSEGRKCGVKGLVQWRGLMIWSRSWFRTTGKGRERVTGFPYISPISSGLRWRGERDIPKNAFFLGEEVLIYDAPESATFPRIFSSSATR